jgi:thiamine pyrophosphokinase
MTFSEVLYKEDRGMKKRVKTTPATALILCNGKSPSQQLVRECLRTKPFVVCADGGANVAARLGIRPDLIIGDCDSVMPKTRKQFASVPLLQITDQENTDLEKALDYLLKKKIRSIVVLGATGNRADHAFANLSILAKYRKKLYLSFRDDDGEIFAIPERWSGEVGMGTIISLLPLGKCSGITTTGLKFPLKNESLEPGVREGLSNMSVEDDVGVRVRAGCLLLFVGHREYR